MDKASQLETVATNDDIISINDRKKLDKIKQDYPNIEIIIGNKTDDDKPISLDLAGMERSKIEILDAASEHVMGIRSSRLERPVRFPLPLVTGIIGFLLGVGATFYVYTM